MMVRRDDEEASSCTYSVKTGRGGQIGTAWTSHVGDREFGSQSNKTNDLQMDTCRFLAMCSALL